MFDKILCKRIHKKNIKLRDVVEYIMESIPGEIIPIYLLSCLLVGLCSIGIGISVLYTPFITLGILIGIVLIVNIIIYTAEFVGDCILKVFDVIGNIDIAQCPLQKDDDKKE